MRLVVQCFESVYKYFLGFDGDNFWVEGVMLFCAIKELEVFGAVREIWLVVIIKDSCGLALFLIHLLST